MNPELKTLMDRATDRPEVFTPDPAALVTAGRRRRRNRRIAGSMATLAAVAGIAAGVVVAVELQDPRGVAPASQPKPPDRLCTLSHGEVVGPEVQDWTEVLSVKDEYGSASIVRAPGGSQYAYCVLRQRGVPQVPYAARGGVLVRKNALRDNRSLTTVFGRAYGTNVRVMVRTEDGKAGVAAVKSKFYIYRHVENEPWPGRLPAVVTQTFDARGNLTAVGRW